MRTIGKKNVLIAGAGSLATAAALAAGAAESAAGGAGAAATDVADGGRQVAAQNAQGVKVTPGERLLAVADKVGPTVLVPAGKVARFDEQWRSYGDTDGKPGYQAGRSVTWIEFIVDPATGAYLGERDVAARDFPEDAVRAGDVFVLSSQRESIVNRIG
ncbi:hypothetical protein [Kribbella deserti]|uniref:Uncharacterized protein n=1 Tax=Kribbella deserti TaxID=1926257 RepID=A0ABV6QG23_9ACTN